MRHGLLSLDDVTEFWRVIMKIKPSRDALCWPHNSKDMTIMNCLCTVSNAQVLSTNFSVTFNNPGQTAFRICTCADRYTAHSTIPKAIYIATVDGLLTLPQGFKNYLPTLVGLSRMGVERGVYRILLGKPEGRKPLGRARRRWVDNIRMDLQVVGCGYMD